MISETVREGLRFLQRAGQARITRPPPVARRAPADVGKMPRELTQSAALVDWWHDYRYGYNHADSTPWYLVAMGDYLRASGDTAFVRESWPSIAAAWRWCRGRDSDGDGLLDITGAGLGALEFGQYTGIHTDCYTAALYLQAARAMAGLAAAAGDAVVQVEAEAALARGQAALERRFWLEEESIYAYGIAAGGEQVRDLTPWPAAALAFGLAVPDRSVRMLRRLNGAEMATDWGFRTLSARSPLYQPLSYNYGAVMPFVSLLVNTAQFRHGFALPGWAALRGVAAHAFDHGLGVVPEVFSGAANMKVGEAYHNQGFSTAAYVAPLLRGLLGLAPDAPAGRLTFAPALPADWDFVRVNRVPLGERRVDLSVRRTATGLTLEATLADGDPMELVFRPLLPPGTRVACEWTAVPRRPPWRLARGECPRRAPCASPARRASELILDEPPAVFLLPAESAVGDSDRGPRVIDQAWTGDGLRVELAGRPGTMRPGRHAAGAPRRRGRRGAAGRAAPLHHPRRTGRDLRPHVITFAITPRKETPWQPTHPLARRAARAGARGRRRGLPNHRRPSGGARNPDPHPGGGAAEIAVKMDRLRALMAAQGLDGVLLTQVRNVWWITAGTVNNQIVLNKDVGAASLLVLKDGRRWLLCSGSEAGRMMDEGLARLGYQLLEYNWYEANPAKDVRADRLARRPGRGASAPTPISPAR